MAVVAENFWLKKGAGTCWAQ